MGGIMMGVFGLEPKLPIPNIWLANILVKLLLAHELASIG